MPQQRLTSYKEIYDGLCEQYPDDDVLNFFNQHENDVLRRHGLDSATPVQGREEGSPALGSANGQSEWGMTGVIGRIEKTGTGNTVLPVGHLLDSGGWEKSEHVVLSPNEREQLIAELIAQR